MTRRAIIGIAFIFALICVGLIIDEDSANDVIYSHEPVVDLTAVMETEPVLSRGDAADDAAIWYNSANPSASAIIGTDKELGLIVYDLDGKIIQSVTDGSMNNVDIRNGFPLDGETVAIVAASNQTDESVALYKMNPQTRKLENVQAREITTIPPYGCCLYKSPSSGKFYYYVNSRDGDIEQWELFDNGSGKVDAKKVRSMQVPSRPEGCVADDALGYFYITEQEFGIWKFGAEPWHDTQGTVVDSIRPGGHLDRQLEGLDLYQKSDKTGYLIVSTQGTSEFVVYHREDDNDYVITFRVVSGNGIDEVTHTDGIDVSSMNLGPNFPEGMLVVQDHLNDGYNQNFKVVPWRKIRQAIAEEHK